MKRIEVYEAEPGDWRFSEEPWGYYVEVTDEELAELRAMEAARKALNSRLEALKAKEVDECE